MTPIALAAGLLLAAAPLASAEAICIRSYQIQQTEIQSDSAILFHMKDGTTYRNTLPQRCVGLKAAINGISYEPTNPGTDELCDNLADFKVNDQTGRTCLFGAFHKL